MKNIFVTLTLGFAFAATASEKKVDWKPCEKEMKEFHCKGSDKEVWECLEKHDDKLGKECQVPHAAADAQFKK